MLARYNEKIGKALRHARFIAETYSNDRSSKIGALILGADWEPLSWGYNGFPRRIDETVEARHERPAKYVWTEHAERNAYFNAARSGHELLGARMAVSGLCPCADCARGAIQCGINEIYLEKAAFDESNPRAKAWLEGWPVTREMLTEAGVRIYVMTAEDQVHKTLSNLV
jgi:dCMP deaminase